MTSYNSWAGNGPALSAIDDTQVFIKSKNFQLASDKDDPKFDNRFLVVAAGEVVLDSHDVEVCKDYLMNKFGNGASTPQRMVCEVIDNKVKDDPHTCGGQNQGGGVDAGFNKFWRGWDEIREMNAVAQKYIDDKV